MESGRYERIRLLASGGMGEVHLGRREGPGGFVKPIVIKRILRYLAREPEQVRQFLAEARLAALIDHPNVVQVFELGEDADGYFIVMEYVHGRSVRSVLRAVQAAGARIPPLIAARIVADALRGLHAAHGLVVRGSAHPIVHRDVSPENILVSFAGVTKVTDFGIAKALHADSQTRPGTLKGKYAYMAPEVIEAKSADLRIDVYAAGTVLFELLAGAPPFTAESTAAVLRDIVTIPPPDICELSPSCPSELGAIVARALMKAPADRFNGAGEMCAALETFLFSAPVQVGSERVGSWLTELFGQAEANLDVLTASGAAAQPTAETVAASPLSKRRPNPAAGRNLPRERFARGAAATAALLLVAALALTFQSGVALPTFSPPDAELRAPAAAPATQHLVPAAPAPVPASVGHDAPPEASTPAPQPEDRPAPSVTAAAQPPRPPRPHRAIRGRVTVQVHPWAEVFLHGRSIGVTPLLEPVEVPAGRVVFVLKNDALGVSRRVVLEVAAGKTVVLRENLLAR